MSELQPSLWMSEKEIFDNGGQTTAALFSSLFSEGKKFTNKYMTTNVFMLCRPL